jgi:hypothetical protein
MSGVTRHQRPPNTGWRMGNKARPKSGRNQRRSYRHRSTLWRKRFGVEREERKYEIWVVQGARLERKGFLEKESFFHNSNQFQKLHPFKIKRKWDGLV